MSLDLDERQRAILQEMGVRVWQPLPEAAPLQPDAAPVSSDPVQAVVNAIKKEAAPAMNTSGADQKAVEFARSPQPGGGADMASAALPVGVEAMDWSHLQQAVAQCQACSLSTGRRAPVFGSVQAPPLADWLVVGEPPEEAEERLGAPFADQAGQLLDNMLKAVGVYRGGTKHSGSAAAYVTNVVKCRPAAVRNPTAQELALCEHYLRREVALVQPKVILALGRFAAQSLLRDSVPEVAGVPLGKLRGQIYRYQGIAVVVSYHPAYLLRSQGDKARAWADLCLARSVFKPPLAT